MCDLVTKHDGEFILVLHHRERAAAHHNLSTGISHPTVIARMRIEMKLVGQLTLRVLRNLVADFLQVSFDRFRFRGVGKSLRLLERGEERVASPDFIRG